MNQYIKSIIDGLILSGIDVKNNSTITLQNQDIIKWLEHILLEEEILYIFDPIIDSSFENLIINNGVISRWLNQNKKVLPKDFSLNSTILYLWMSIAGENLLNNKPSKQAIHLRVGLSNFDTDKLCNILKKYFKSNKVYVSNNFIVIEGECHNKFIQKCKENNIKFQNREYKFII